MKQLIEAVLNVMEDCTGIEKSMTVGTGNNSYKGVSDKDVKLKIGESMRKHGLIILPIDIVPTTKVNTWEEASNYGTKIKQSVFTEVITKYLLAHKSGESTTIVGYGHGVDTQDKGAGKATTYALKYALLYSFLVATGHIDDSDNIHSDNIPLPIKSAVAKNAPTEKQFAAMIEAITKGQIDKVQQRVKSYALTEEQSEKLKQLGIIL